LGYHYNVAVTGLYTLKSVSATSGRNLLLTAIKQAASQHPNLALQVRANDTGAPFFVRLSEIDIEKITEFVDVSIDQAQDSTSFLGYLSQTLSNQNSKRFDHRNLPLWRMLILNLGNHTANTSDRRYAVIFVYHHVIADGMSGLAMHQAMLDHLEKLDDGVDETKSGYALHTELDPSLPNMENLIHYSQSWKLRLISLLHLLATPWHKSILTGRWTGAPHYYNPAVPTLTHIRLIEVPAKDTSRIRERCHLEGCSVTSLLQVVVGLAIFEHFSEAKSLRCATAISLRRFFPESTGIDNSKIGLWIDSFHDNFTRKHIVGPQAQESDGIPWKTARKSKAHIDRKIADGLSNLDFAALEKVKDFKSMMLHQPGSRRANSYSIVNLGVYEASRPVRDIASDKCCSLDQMFLSQSAHINGSAIQFCIVSTKRGGMGISLNWQDSMVATADVDAIAEKLKQKLMKFG
jgi:hypothetical protein